MIAFFAAFSTASHAEPAKIEHVIKLLHEAKASDHPVPLLEKARGVLKDFNGAHPLAMTASGIGRRRAASIQIGENEKKHKAMEAITKAIKSAKAGIDVKAEIESAIAFTHSAG